MEIRIESLRTENFAGLSYHFEPKGENVTLFAENMAGKTRLFSSWLWLMFGKDAEGKTDFDLRPLDKDNNVIKGDVIVVEGVLSIGDEKHTFRKEHHEKIVKKQITGYEARCFIDEVPKKKNEYEAYIAEILQEHTFKMLTDTDYFNGKLHHTKRREVLINIAGKIGTPEGFNELMDNLNGRSIKDYKSVLDGQRKAYEKERAEINPRMSEIRRGFEGLGETEAAPAGKQREAEFAIRAELDSEKAKLLNSESERSAKLDIVCELKSDKAILEGKLKQGDQSKVLPLMKEKNDWEKKVADQAYELRRAVNDGKSAKNTLEDRQAELKRCMDKLNILREKAKELKKESLDDKCYACGRTLEADKIEELKATQEKAKRDLSVSGSRIKKESDTLKEICENASLNLQAIQDDIKKLDIASKEMDNKKDAAIAEIDKKIEGCRKGVDPTKDDEWIRLDKELKAAEAEVSESMTDQMRDLDEKRDACNNRIDDLNKILNNADRFQKDTDRLKELGEREKELAQLIADVEKLLNDIDEYGAEESRMIEQAVNDKFKHVEFKLFKTLLNGSIEPTCEAVYKGTPYTGMSTGERIFVGIDIINTLSKHYKTSVVLFIDHLESLTMPVETDAQVIGLVAEKGTKKLTVK